MAAAIRATTTPRIIHLRFDDGAAAGENGSDAGTDDSELDPCATIPPRGAHLRMHFTYSKGLAREGRPRGSARHALRYASSPDILRSQDPWPRADPQLKGIRREVRLGPQRPGI